MNRKIKELMERMVIKMLEDDLKNSESIISSQDGKTTISMKQNNMVSLLLYLQLTSEEKDTSYQQRNDRLESLDILANSHVHEQEEMTNDFNENEKVLEKIKELQQKNKQFQEEMVEILKEQ